MVVALADAEVVVDGSAVVVFDGSAVVVFDGSVVEVVEPGGRGGGTIRCRGGIRRCGEGRTVVVVVALVVVVVGQGEPSVAVVVVVRRGHRGRPRGGRPVVDVVVNGQFVVDVVLAGVVVVTSVVVVVARVVVVVDRVVIGRVVEVNGRVVEVNGRVVVVAGGIVVMVGGVGGMVGRVVVVTGLVVPGVGPLAVADVARVVGTVPRDVVGGGRLDAGAMVVVEDRAVDVVRGRVGGAPEGEVAVVRRGRTGIVVLLRCVVLLR